jgi:PAS domain S-box-containing protein
MEPSKEQIQSELQRILTSGEFRRSGRSQQFLAHVVDSALRGDAMFLKESTLGSVLFGREPGYDAASDPSVRVRASDVRKRLLAYYHSAGAGDPVKIELSPGSYVPKFTVAEPARAYPSHRADDAGVLVRLLTGAAQAIAGVCAHVGALHDGDAVTVKTVAAVAVGKVAENFEYPLAGSAAESIVGVHGSAGVREWNGQWHAGAPLFDSRGRLLGLLSVVSASPPEDRQLAQALLAVYAARVAAELERSLAERALLAETPYRAIFESAGIGISAADLQGTLIATNRAFEIWLGYGEVELAGRPFAAVMHPEDVDIDLRLYAELLEGKRDRYHVGKRFLHKDGHILWGDLTVTLLRGPDCAPRYIIGVVQENSAA